MTIQAFNEFHKAGYEPGAQVKVTQDGELLTVKDIFIQSFIRNGFKAYQYMAILSNGSEIEANNLIRKGHGL